jgi:hypothetical protein
MSAGKVASVRDVPKDKGSANFGERQQIAGYLMGLGFPMFNCFADGSASMNKLSDANQTFSSQS